MMRVLLLLAVLASCNPEDLKKRKVSEAQLIVNKITKLAKAYSIEKGKFPVGQTGVTPAIDCCAQQNVKCQPDPKAWEAAPWRELDFRMEEPHNYRYSYESADGTTFTVKAVADLDCDTDTATYVTATGKLVDGAPSVTIDNTLVGKE